MPVRGRSSGDIAGTLYERHAEMCKVFSNATRLKIMNDLRESEMTVAAIAGKLGVRSGTVSPHLLMMKRRGVLVSRKQGNQVFYRPAKATIFQAFDLIREILYEQMKQERLLVRRLEHERTRKRRTRGHP
jgi:ArsR family transcriptional regulator